MGKVVRKIGASVPWRSPCTGECELRARCTLTHARTSTRQEYLQLIRGTQPQAARDSVDMWSQWRVWRSRTKSSLSPVRFILPLAVARCREWRTPFPTPALRLLLNNISNRLPSQTERATKDFAPDNSRRQWENQFFGDLPSFRGLWLILFIFAS